MRGTNGLSQVNKSRKKDYFIDTLLNFFVLIFKKCISAFRICSTRSFILLLILSLSTIFMSAPTAKSVGLTNVSIFVAENRTVDINDFRISRDEVYQHHTLFFTCTVGNLGNVQVNINPKIIIKRSGETFTEMDLEEISIPARGNTTTTISWNVGEIPTGLYSAVFYFKNEGMDKLETKNFNVLFDSGDSNLSPYRVEEEKKNETLVNLSSELLFSRNEGVSLEFTRIPLLLELKEGEVFMFDIGLKNAGNKSINKNELNLSIRGVPEDWIEYGIDYPSKLITPESLFHVRMFFSIPKNTEVGDRVVTVSIGHSNVNVTNKAFFVLRVNPLNITTGQLGLARTVDVDRESGSTNVRIRVENQGHFINRFELIEKVPETLGDGIDKILFEDPPVELSESINIVKWNFGELEQGATKETSYSVKKIPEEYSMIVYWPVKQINVYQLKPVRELDVYWESEILISGKEGDIVAHLFNFDSNPLGVTILLEPKGGWEVFPESVTTTIAGGGDERLIFRVKPPVGEEGGIYQIKSIVRYDEEQKILNVPVRVDESPSDAVTDASKQTMGVFDFELPGRLFTVISLLAVIVILQTILLIFKFLKDA